MRRSSVRVRPQAPKSLVRERLASEQRTSPTAIPTLCSIASPNQSRMRLPVSSRFSHRRDGGLRGTTRPLDMSWYPFRREGGSRAQGSAEIGPHTRSEHGNYGLSNGRFDVVVPADGSQQTVCTSLIDAHSSLGCQVVATPSKAVELQGATYAVVGHGSVFEFEPASDAEALGEIRTQLTRALAQVLRTD